MSTKFTALMASTGVMFSAALCADQHPTYSEDDATLVLPSITLNNKPGHFQEAELELIQDNLWLLRGVKEGKLNQDIKSVELIRTDSFPVQVFLKVTGEFTHGCAREGQVQSQLIDNTFVVNAYYENNIWTETPEIVLCAAVITPFSFVYPLKVYGLDAGDYEYELNSKFSGSFTLTENNVYESSSPAW
jgi:hypothetical protein